MIGRPMKKGALYYESRGEGYYGRWKYFVKYCENCEHKQGLTSEELDEFVESLPGGFSRTIKRLTRMRIVIPK